MKKQRQREEEKNHICRCKSTGGTSGVIFEDEKEEVGKHEKGSL